jgi:hypothetical protein
MTDTTVLVDRKAEDAKNAQKVLEVADSIVESPLPIVQPNRKWVKGERICFFFSVLLILPADGPVGLIVGPGDVRPRYAFLFTDVLLLCMPIIEPAKKGKKEEAAAAAAAAVAAAAAKVPMQYRFQRELSLLAANVQSIRDDEGGPNQNLLVVRSPKLAFVLQAQSAADKAAWIRGIVSVIEMRKAGSLSLQSTGTTRGSGANSFNSGSGMSGAESARSSATGKLVEVQVRKSASADEDLEHATRGMKSEESESDKSSK